MVRHMTFAVQANKKAFVKQNYVKPWVSLKTFMLSRTVKKDC